MEPAASVEPQSSDQRDAPLSYADVVKGKPTTVPPPATADVSSVNQNDPCVPKSQYVDVVKSTYETPEPCVAGPSHSSSGYATESSLSALSVTRPRFRTK